MSLLPVATANTGTRSSALFVRYVATNDLSAPIHHEPGRSMQVYWAGQTLSVTDMFTGRVSKAYLFAAVLPYSGMVFARASLSMNLEAWIDLHVRARIFWRRAADRHSR